MAAKKPRPDAVKTGTHAPPIFSRAKLLKIRRYANRRDLLSAVLEDGRMYTLDQADALIRDFIKGKVK